MLLYGRLQTTRPPIKRHCHPLPLGRQPTSIPDIDTGVVVPVSSCSVGQDDFLVSLNQRIRIPDLECCPGYTQTGCRVYFGLIHNERSYESSIALGKRAHH